LLVISNSSKSDVRSIFCQLKGLLEKQFGFQIKHLYSDNGGEYYALHNYLSSNSISWLTTAPHTPQQNGTSERRHRHIVETGLTLLSQAHLSPSYWSYAFQTAVYLINRMPSSVLQNRSPFECLFGRLPDYTKMRIFGCQCYPWLKPYTTSKLHSKSMPCLFLSYSTTQSAYKCMDLNSSRIYLSRHVVFDESHFPFLTFAPVTMPSLSISGVKAQDLHIPAVPSIGLPPSSTTIVLTSSFTASSLPSPPPTQPPSTDIHPYTSPAASQQPIRTHPMTTRSMNNIHKPEQLYLATKYPLPSPIKPTCVSQALQDPKWRNAMFEEFTALVKHGTWELVPPSFTIKPIGCKWVFRIKRNSDGSISRYKARLVAKGFHQQYGFDYTETFSPVVKSVTIRTVLSIAVNNKWPLRQLDVNNAFLHGQLQENVFMVQPPGFIDSTLPSHICRLKKSLYGLKQAPRAWYQELRTSLLQLGFQQSKSNSSLFIYTCDGVTIFLLVYVDDLLITGSDSTSMSKIIKHLSTRFSLKDLSSLHYFLGVEVFSVKQGLFLSQHKYIYDLLTCTNMDGAKTVKTPLATKDCLQLNDGSSSVNPTAYRCVIGALQYLSLSRPDISFPVNKLAQFLQKPSQLHWIAAKRVLRYLKGTLHHGILLKRTNDLTLQGFSDADWAGDKDTRVSTSAYLIFLGDCPISWSTRKQRAVARSSTEAEYRALASGHFRNYLDPFFTS
jgi:histone deacetylase 1/2